MPAELRRTRSRSAVGQRVRRSCPGSAASARREKRRGDAAGVEHCVRRRYLSAVTQKSCLAKSAKGEDDLRRRCNDNDGAAQGICRATDRSGGSRCAIYLSTQCPSVAAICCRTCFTDKGGRVVLWETCSSARRVCFESLRGTTALGSGPCECGSFGRPFDAMNLSLLKYIIAN